MIENFNRLKHPAFWVLLAGILLSAFIILAKPKEQPAAYQPPPPPQVEAVEVVPGLKSVTVHSQGTVEPRTSTQLISQVAGQVQKISENFVAGGFFQTGEILVSIDARDYEIALAQAKSTLASAEQLLAEVKGQALQAKREWRDLGNKEANDLFLRKPQLASAQASVEAAKAGVTKAMLDIQRTQISLPYDGRVLATAVDIGQYLSPGAVVGEVFGSDIVEVRLPLTANQIRVLELTSKPQPGSKLPVVLTASFGNQDFSWQAEIVRIEASVDPKTRLFYAVAEVVQPNPSQAQSRKDSAILPVGMFVKAKITSPRHQGVVVLPRSALIDRNHILAVNNNIAEAVIVSVLEINPEQVKVQGLQAGQKVLISPPGYLTTGMEVNTLAVSDLGVTE